MVVVGDLGLSHCQYILGLFVQKHVGTCRKLGIKSSDTHRLPGGGAISI